MGDDSSIVCCRVSYGKGTKKYLQTRTCKYLMRHWHSTPFEMCEIKYHVKLPILLQDNGQDIEQQMLMNILRDIQY